jgi:hypothetical protein
VYDVGCVIGAALTTYLTEKVVVALSPIEAFATSEDVVAVAA